MGLLLGSDRPLVDEGALCRTYELKTGCLAMAVRLERAPRCGAFVADTIWARLGRARRRSRLPRTIAYAGLATETAIPVERIP